MPVTQHQRELKPAAASKAAKATKPFKLVSSDFRVVVPPNMERHMPPVAPKDTLPDFLTATPHFPVRISRQTRKYAAGDLARQFFVEQGGWQAPAPPPTLLSTYLRPRARFVGEQQSGSSRYDIKVEFKTVDLQCGIVTGFFEISGLTDDHPVITTCFRGEIINNPLAGAKQHSFATEESDWGSFLQNDLEHWKKLTASPHGTTEDELLRRLRRIHAGAADPLHIYMRWKEEFLLPDLRVKVLKNASFEGFYYVVLNIGPGNGTRNASGYSADMDPGLISGLYFHTQNEKFQSLSLRHVETRGGGLAFDFA